MSTTTEHAVSSRTPRLIVGAVSLMLGGSAFTVGGATHPSDRGEGNKVDQLYDMLVAASWYPSHGVLVLSMALFAVGLLTLHQRRDLGPSTSRVVGVVGIITIVATIAMTVHLLGAVNADALANGESSFSFWLQTANEVLVNATWAVGMTVLAVVGGLTRTLGNRVTLVIGLVGGCSFAIASGTIPFTDLFDVLFPVASLLGLWAVVVGALALRRPA